MDLDKLLGGKYVKPKTTPSVPSEATGGDSGDIEAGEGKLTNKPANKPGERRSTKK